jgi:hypothetical protein
MTQSRVWEQCELHRFEVHKLFQKYLGYEYEYVLRNTHKKIKPSCKCGTDKRNKTQIINKLTAVFDKTSMKLKKLNRFPTLSTCIEKPFINLMVVYFGDVLKIIIH